MLRAVIERGNEFEGYVYFVDLYAGDEYRGCMLASVKGDKVLYGTNREYVYPSLGTIDTFNRTIKDSVTAQILDMKEKENESTSNS